MERELSQWPHEDVILVTGMQSLRPMIPHQLGCMADTREERASAGLGMV